MSLYFLVLKQTQEKLNAWKSVANQQRPAGGWVKAIRNALRMTSTQLGRRMGVSQPRVSKIEHDEQEGSVTLNTLKKATQAMDSKFIYCIVPNSTLEEMLRAQAVKRAKQQMTGVSHSMMLEEQALTDEGKKVLLEKWVDEILSRSDSKLWDELYDRVQRSRGSNPIRCG